MDPDNEVQFELQPLIRQYKSGRVVRFFNTDNVPAGLDPSTGVTSKDVIIDQSTGASVRIHLPRLTNDPAVQRKLPILVSFHGGAFVIGSAFDPYSHNYLNALAAQASIIAVSVDYRLAPEHPLPAAYDDSWAALKWVSSHVTGTGTEEWLVEHGDFSRVFLAGGSAGANIAHQMALRTGAEGLPSGVRIEGMILIHPYFWGQEPIGSESRDPEFRKKEESMWRFVCPETTGLDDPRVNPVADGAPSLEGAACERVLVAVAEKDWLRERGVAYYEGLKTSGWKGEAKIFETEGEGHGFQVFNPSSMKALELEELVVAFLECQ